jgi:hypothetical protein
MEGYAVDGVDLIILTMTFEGKVVHTIFNSHNSNSTLDASQSESRTVPESRNTTGLEFERRIFFLLK